MERKYVYFALICLMLVLFLAACGKSPSVTSESLYVKQVKNLPKDFILGMDVSAVPSLEDSGVRYYDHQGNKKSVFQILSENGINYIRVRVWNDPFDEN